MFKLSGWVLRIAPTTFYFFFTLQAFRPPGLLLPTVAWLSPSPPLENQPTVGYAGWRASRYRRFRLIMCLVSMVPCYLLGPSEPSYTTDLFVIDDLWWISIEFTLIRTHGNSHSQCPLSHWNILNVKMIQVKLKCYFYFAVLKRIFLGVF